MALSITITISGSSEEKQLLLEALQWYTPKTVVRDEDDKGVVTPRIASDVDGMGVEDATHYHLVRLINSAAEGHREWKRTQRSSTAAMVTVEEKE